MGLELRTITYDIVQIFSMGAGRETDLFRLRKPNSSKFWIFSLTFISFLFAIPIIWVLTRSETSSDLINHANLASEMVQSGDWISYSIYYPLIYLTSLGNHDFLITRIAITLLVSSFFAFKTVIIFQIARYFAKTLGFALAVTAITTLGTALIDPLNPNDIYLGQFAPTVWHNSTTIMAEPFALLAFASFMWVYSKPSIRASIYLSALISICVMCKPSFAIAFLPIAGVALLVKFLMTKEQQLILKLAITFLPVTTVIFIQYLSTFGSHLVQWHTTIAPLATWQTFSDNLPLSFCLSFGPSLLAVASFPKFFKQSPALLISWLITCVAFVELLLLAEQNSDGTLSFAGNYFWGIYQCLLVLYLITMKEIIGVATSKTVSLDRSIGLAVATLGFIFHGLSGLYYALSFISTR